MKNLPVNNTGYLKGTKTAKNPVNVIPSNLITTENMAFPIKANGKTLYPNTGQYKFNTPYVVETPLKQKGTKKVKVESKPSWFNTPIEFGKEPGTIGRYVGKALSLGAEPGKGRGYTITPSTTLKGTLEDYTIGKVGGAVIKRAMPYVKPVISKATKPIVDKVAPVANKVTSSIKNIPNYLSNAFTLGDEALGKLFRDKGNKKAIAEGNQWLENWISHPKTQAKINADMDAALAARNKVFDREVELLRRQSKQHKPNVKEYPLRQQLKDLKAGKEHIHSDNAGVSYTHKSDPYWRDMVQKKQYTPSPEYGEWVSRHPFISQKQRVSTVVHEGTHGWASSQALKTSGMRNRVLKEMPNDVKKDFLEWESLRKQGIDPETVMGKERDYNAYISNPTEMHARIMEIRKHFGLTPDDVIDEKRAHGMMKELMDMPLKERPVDIYSMSKAIGSSSKSFANLMNNMWAVPAVGAAGLAVKEKKQGSKNMKPLIKYKDGSKSVSLAFSRGEKDPKGGLTQKGVDKYNRATGGNLKMAVTTPPSKLKPGSKAANRRKSFCARMSGVKGPMEKNGKPTRKALALRKWNC